MTTSQAIERPREVLRRKHLAIATEENYCGWIARFARFVKERCSAEMKMEAFLSQLARQDVSASTQNQAFSALLFFYREVMKVELGKVNALRAKRPEMLRFAPEVHEVRSLLGMGYLHAEAMSVRSPLDAVFDGGGLCAA